ncbi:MAG: hypothetical protein ACPG19_08955 [Saprospiraceae bacterium]
MNKYKLLPILFIFLFAFINTSSINAQNNNEPAHDVASNDQTARYYYVKTKDNTKFTGKIVYHNRAESEIIFQLYDGGYEVTVLTSNILSMRRVKSNDVRNGEYLFPDISGGRYLVTPNGIGLKKGDFQYRTSNLLYHSLSYGVTNYLSVHAGGELYTSISLQQPAYNLGVNLHFPITSTLHFGTNLSFANVYGDYQNMANAYAYITAGNRNHNFSIGYGYGYPTLMNDFQKAKQFIPLSMKFRMGKNLALITENWLVPDLNSGISESYYSYGVRMLWEGFSLDLAFVNNIAFIDEFILGIPMINFVYAIKK